MMEKLSAEDLRFNLREIRRRLVAAAEKSGRREDEITLLAATKTVDVDTINEAVADGVTHIGENCVQELLA